MRVQTVAVGLVLAGALLVSASRSSLLVDVGAQQATTRVCTLKVTGMTCETCAPPVKAAARAVDGVKDATVSYEKGTAVVSYDASKTNPDAIARRVAAQTGYRTSVQK